MSKTKKDAERWIVVFAPNKTRPCHSQTSGTLYSYQIINQCSTHKLFKIILAVAFPVEARAAPNPAANPLTSDYSA